MNRRLYRCREDRVIAGVASGVAEFFGLDPTLVRILWFLSIFVGGFGILAYIGLAIIVPQEPLTGTPFHGAAAFAGVDNQPAGVSQGHRHGAGRGSGRVSLYLGVTLIVIGGFALIDIFAPGFTSWRQLGPILLILFGGFLVLGATRREPTDRVATAPAGPYGAGPYGAASAPPPPVTGVADLNPAAAQEPAER